MLIYGKTSDPHDFSLSYVDHHILREIFKLIPLEDLLKMNIDMNGPFGMTRSGVLGTL